MNISDIFSVETTRPLNALNKVGIAELAQFTPFEQITDYLVADADHAIRREWWWELEPTDREFLTMKSAFVVFKDGSTLAWKVKK